MVRALFLLGLFFAASACGDKQPVADAPATGRAAIEPQQFAFVPCEPIAGDDAPPCFLLAAGGKYFLMGAPEGAYATLLGDEVSLLDGVLLFSLLPGHIDGLDTVRHQTWRQGRKDKLLVAGPEGVGEFTQALDSAFEFPDAELFTRESPAGGFDASLLRAREVSPGASAGTEVVDTGDLKTRGFYAPSGQIVYLVTYEDTSVAVGMCGGEADAQFLSELSPDGSVLDCNDGGEIVYIAK